MASFVENVNKLAANMPVDGWASLDEKVDKVAGKGLSTEDYTSLEKQKLYGIAEGATSNAGDAFLTDRKNHTGKQSIDTITESASLKILTAAERVKLDAISVHPETHPVGIIYGLTNPSKFVKTDAVGNTGFSDVTWSDVQGKPSSFNPNVHQHSLSDLSDAALKADKTYVDTQLSAKTDTSTLTIELAKKADLNIVATDAELQTAVATLQPLSQKGQANGYVPLDSGGKIPNSYLNNLSTIEVFTANSESNMLLLSNVSVGDQCIRTDLVSSNLFILTQTPSTELTNWKQINTSASVLSVNGQTGVVNVSKSDVGLGNVDNTADVNKTVLSATKLATARTISLASDVTGSASFDGSGNISITATIVDNNHSHTLANISDFPSSVSAIELGYLDTVSSNIQTQLNAKQATLVSATNIKTINGNSIVGGGDLVIAGGDMLKTTYDTTNNGIVDKTENLVGGNNTTLLGSIPYQSNTNTTSLLSPNTTTTRKFLRQTGSGTNGSAPVWDTILASDIPVLDTSKITTGTLPVSRGGTGVSTSTGTGSVVLSASPTFTGTVTAPTFSGELTGNATTATTASDSNKLNGRTFNWSGQSGQPDWVWGGRNSDTNNMYVWNPSNFNVAYATNATNATNVSGGYGMFSGLITTKLCNSAFNVGSDNALSVRGDATYPAYINFHRAGTYAANFGIDTDNKLKFGGWSAGNVYEIYHQGNQPPSVGVGQTWQDVTASRVLGTTYTNSTGKPIQIAVTVQASALGNQVTVAININSVLIAYTASGYVTSGFKNSSPIIIPNGATYSITNVDVTSSIIKWSELR